MSWMGPYAVDWTALDFLALVLRLTCLPILLSTLELLAARAALGDHALMSWEVSRLRHPMYVVGPTGRICQALLNYPTYLRLLGLRGLLAAALLAGPSWWLLQPTVVAVMCGLLLLASQRSLYGQDGADQMQMIVWVAALPAVVFGGETAAALCLWFIAFQACMAYTIAGISKVRAAGWRRGRFLAGVLGTTIYGSPRVGAFLRRHRRTAFAGSWAVMLFELTFPLAWLAPWPWGLTYLAVGCVFHVANAVVMGLGSFLLTFLATYPAVWFTLERKGW